MRWKKGSPKIILNTSGLAKFETIDTIAVIDIYGHIYFDLKITGRGKNMRIGNKCWQEVKDKIIYWQYMNVIEVEIIHKLGDKYLNLLLNPKDTGKNLPKGFRLFNNTNKSNIPVQNLSSDAGYLYIKECHQWHIAKMHISEKEATDFVSKKKIDDKNCKFIKDKFILDDIKKYIIKYYNVLSMKWKQTHFIDDYGKMIVKDWEQHLKYFLINVVSSENKKLEFVIINIFNEKAFGYNERYKQRFIKEIDKLYNVVDKEMEKQNTNIPTIKTGVDYENYIESLLLSGNFNVLRTPTTGDQGVDLVVVKNDIRIAIQCKYYSKPVGNKAVQEVIAGRDFYNCQIACVVSNNTFTSSARKIANVANVMLLNENNIVATLMKATN